MIDEYNDSNPNCVYKALQELKEQQDQLEGSPTSCFSSLFKKLFKVDTIPFLLFNEDGLFELAGLQYGEKDHDHHHFHTKFFRIEHLDEEKNCASLSLLRPISIYSSYVDDICAVDRLERTNICVTVDLSCFCAIQCLDVDLLKKIVIEPKW
ncbi:CotY/CotZ family spore coat protein [Metabacillus litoralis]|nr:CotY/CotZ family spore coat protein [Metabacillus litoralis]